MSVSYVYCSDVWVVRPSKMQLKTFSIYGNFAECDDVGSPTHSEHYGAWAHLSRLLNTAVKQVGYLLKRRTLFSGENLGFILH